MSYETPSKILSEIKLLCREVEQMCHTQDEQTVLMTKIHMLSDRWLRILLLDEDYEV